MDKSTAIDRCLSQENGVQFNDLSPWNKRHPSPLYFALRKSTFFPKIPSFCRVFLNFLPAPDPLPFAWQTLVDAHHIPIVCP